jgi:hypothetical protein
MLRAATITRFQQEASSLRILRRIVGAFLIVYAPLALFSGYRAVWQLYSVSLDTPATLGTGSRIRYGAVGSGRVTVRVQLQLTQTGRTDTLFAQLVREHTEPSLDPRPIRGSYTARITAEQLAHFSPGPATLRVIAFGRSQWLRTPPPKAVEKQVVIAR